MWEWLRDLVIKKATILGDLLLQYGPPWLPKAAAATLWAVATLFGLICLLEVFNRARKIIGEGITIFSEAERKRNKQRRRFSRLLTKRMDDLNRALQWSDEVYTDLEAEVEAEGRCFHSSVLFWLLRSRSQIRRDKSLTHAISSVHERLVTLEGPAGCGKSVALRYVAARLARAADHWSNSRPIAVYVNLKTLTRKPEEEVDAALIDNHVRRYINELGYPDFDPFFTAELTRAREDGSMIFLFDSFDEIPEILSATDGDDRVRAYGNAIDAFLGGLGVARAVVASRPFRGPKRLGWPVFRVLPLTLKRQSQFIRMSRLGGDVESQMLGELPNARLDLQAIAENPLFLRLLCEHVRTRRTFPANLFEVFDTFVDNRLRTDEHRLFTTSGTSARQLREFAESAAFAMQAEISLGLSPACDQLISAFAADNTLPPQRTRQLLDLLVDAGFGTIGKEGGIESFSFRHRRLQEYFATAVILRDPDRLPPEQILLDGRWRETAVTLLQLRPAENLTSLLDCAAKLLEQMSTEVAGLGTTSQVRSWFPWPNGALHLLGLLQHGMSIRDDLASADLQAAAASIVLHAYDTGTVLDQKWAIESAGTLAQKEFESVLIAGISSNFEVLRDPAFRQAARLTRLPARIDSFIRVLLLRRAFRRDIQKNTAAAFVQLRRLPDGDRFVSMARRLTICCDIDYALCFWPMVAGVSAIFYDVRGGFLSDENERLGLLL